MSRLHGFDEDGVKRVIHAVRRIERSPLNTAEIPASLVGARQPTFIGKTDAAFNKGTSGVVSIWSGTPGSETDTTYNLTAWNLFANVAIGKWVALAHNGSGWYLIAAEC